MTDTYAPPPPSGPRMDDPDDPLQPLDPDAEADALEAASRFHQQVAVEADRIRIRRAAAARVAAEQAADLDFNGAYLDRTQLEDLTAPTPLIKHVLPRHSYGLLSGRDGTLKTFTALSWSLCLATGRPWLGHHADRVPVLYIAGEGAHGLAKRVRAWEFGFNRGQRVDPAYFTVRTSALNLHTPGPAFDDLLHRVDVGRYGLVVIDTLRRVSGAADGNSSEMGLVIDNLDRIKNATADGSVLVIAHTGKDDRDVRGYSGIEDDADFVWHTKRRDNQPDLELKLAKMKDAADGRTLRLSAVPVLESLTIGEAADTVAAETLTDSQTVILDTLRDAFPDGAHTGQLRKATGLPESTYYRAMGALRSAGLVQNTGTPTRPFLVRTTPDDDSQTLPDLETGSDLRDSHDSHQLPLPAPITPTTPTTLRVGEVRAERQQHDQETSE